MRTTAALFVLLLASPAIAGPFDTPPERYDETVNVALQQVGSDLRVRQTTCTAARCRFVAREVSVEVSGPADRSATERITVAATFRQGDDGAAASLLDDTLMVVGATMVARHCLRVMADRGAGTTRTATC